MILYIPLEYIRFNVKAITKLSLTNIIYILCKSGKRSNAIKKIYFKDIININSLRGGISTLMRQSKILKNLKVNVVKGRPKHESFYFSELLIIATCIYILYLLLYVDK